MSDGAKKKKPNQPETETRTSRRQRQLPPELTPLSLPTRSKSCDIRVLSPNTVTPRLPDYAVTKPKGDLFRGAYLFPFAAKAADTRVSKTTGDELAVSSDHDNPTAPGKPKPGVGLVNRQEPENVFQFDDPEETEATPQPPSAAKRAADTRETKTIENEPNHLTGELLRPVGETEPNRLTRDLLRPVGEPEPNRLTGELLRPVGSHSKS